MLKIGDYYNLKENKESILSSKEENGYEDQYFRKEDIKWVVLDIKENGDILLISEKPTEQELWLKGKEGYNNGINIMNRLCQGITGIENARNITEEDIIQSEYWKDDKKKELIFGTGLYYWVASRYAGADSSGAYFGLRRADSYVGSHDLFFSNSGSYYNYYRLRPVVYLKSNELEGNND